ncbi:MAG: HAD family hydrolase [Clostridia bacterium]
MKIRAILLDFDGTSLQRDQTFLSFRNMYAIRRAMEKGIQIIPCTGRCEDMFPPQIDAEKQIRYWVTSSGTRVVDRQTGEVISQCVLTPEESAELCRIFEGQSVYAELSADGLIFLEKEINDHLERYPVPPHHVWFNLLNRQRSIALPSAYFLSHGISMEKCNLYGVPKEKQADFIRQFNESGLVTLTDGAGTDMQFFPTKLDKVASIEKLLKRLGLTFDELMCLGDSAMDATVIARSGLGIAALRPPSKSICCKAPPRSRLSSGSDTPNCVRSTRCAA